MMPPEPPHDISDHRAFRPANTAILQDVAIKPEAVNIAPVLTPGGPVTAPTPTHHTHGGPLSRGPSPQPSLGGRFLRDPRNSTNPGSRAASQSPMRLSMPAISPGQLAFGALQYLPVPTLVLNSLKTVVLANEAFGRLLGIVHEDIDEEDASLFLERLRGQTLSQVGIDMLQDGRPVWVTWEAILDTLVQEMGVRASSRDRPGGGDETPTLDSMPSSNARRTLSGARTTQDAVMEVVVSRKELRGPVAEARRRSKDPNDLQVSAKMIISIWELEDKQTYFTLTFTNTQSAPSSLVTSRKSIAKPSILEAAERKTISTPSILSNPPSVSSSRDSSSPSFSSPGAVTMSSSPFPPMGPPSVVSQSSAPSVLQKMIRMKDALLDNAQVPILAVWKDGSVSFPNKAARQLFRIGIHDTETSPDGLDILEKWDLWTEDFTEQLDPSQYPISILLRTETPFASIRVGVYGLDGEKLVYDCVGEAIRDEATGEFLAGVITGRDCTSMTKEITEIKEKDEERFKLICDTMPQLVWTATPDGMHDFFNTRWYSYTGLTPEDCLGTGWKLPFHPDDVAESNARWKHSLATGAPYMTEYRCRSKTGEWRWFLGRALAVRNKESGEIEKWFGV